MRTLWNQITGSFTRKKSFSAAQAGPECSEKTLEEARTALAGMNVDELTVGRQLQFAQSLLLALGENPSTLQNQVLAHQMAIEQLKMRHALLQRATRA